MTKRLVKFSREWKYSLNGWKVLTANPGDEVLLPEDLAAAAVAGEFGTVARQESKPAPALETKPAPAAPEGKAPSRKATPKGTSTRKSRVKKV